MIKLRTCPLLKLSLTHAHTLALSNSSFKAIVSRRHTAYCSVEQRPGNLLEQAVLCRGWLATALHLCLTVHNPQMGFVAMVTAAW